MNYQHIRVVPASAYVGAEIGGVDLARPVGDEALGEIRRAFGEYGVVFFRDQKLSPEQHIAVAERFWHYRHQPLLRACPRSSDDRRGPQGAGADSQYRRRLAHRS
jgi:taurine dioxygenase